MWQRLGICILIAAAAPAADKPNRDIQELQRDLAQLQDAVKSLQAGLDQRFTAVAGQMQAMAGSVEKVNATVGALQKGIDQMAQEQERKIVPMMAAQGSRLDQAADGLHTMQQAMTDLTAAITKLQNQIGDMNNAVKVLSQPTPKPPGADQPPIGAVDLITNADGDREGGKTDLALQEYTDFLKWYADSPSANVAQFQIGMLHYDRKDYESAAKDFDTMAQKYPDSKRLPDALFYKRKSLQALGRNAEAAQVCQELRQKFPSHDLARQCATAAPRR